MNPMRNWAIACYEFVFAEPGTEWWDVSEEIEEDEDEDYASETDLEIEDFGLVHYRIQALGGDTFIEFSYEGELDEAAIVQALTHLWQTHLWQTHLWQTHLWQTHLWQTAPRPNPQLAGTLRLPIAPAYPVQSFFS